MLEKCKLKIKLPQLIIEAATLLLLAVFTILFIIFYRNAPSVIVREEGVYSDLYSIKKTSLIVLYIICAAVYALITFLQFFPKLWADSEELNPKAADCLKNMVSVTKTIFVAVLFYITIASLKALKISDVVLIIAIVFAVLEIAFFLSSFFIISKKSADKSL